jgi:hypothetical protein
MEAMPKTLSMLTAKRMELSNSYRFLENEELGFKI